MGADYYYGAFYGVLLEEIVKFSDRETIKIKYNEDTGKPYEIKEKKIVWTMGDKEWILEGTNHWEATELAEEIANSLGLEVAEDNGNLKYKDYIIGIKLASGNIDYDNRIPVGQLQLNKTIDKVNTVLSAFPDSLPRLFVAGWAYC